jgi:hypothetical protein
MINIKRESTYADKLRSYNVELDGVIIGEIADGESKAFQVEPGEHTLRLKIDWLKSNEVQFEASDDVIEFICSNGLGGVKDWFVIFYLMFMPNRYIRLKRLG